MSFSGNVKEELSHHLGSARHCRIAETAAIISICGGVMIDSRGRYSLKIHTENLSVARKCFTLLTKTFNIRTDIAIRTNRMKGSVSYYIVVKEHDAALRILQATKLIDQYGEVEEELSVVRNIVIQETCCKRAFIRGAFLASGSMSDPEKSYHFEIVCATREKAEQIQKIMKCFELDGKIVLRKKSFVVYLKEGSQIADVLNVMEAHVALMEFENVRILKDMRNTVNRKVNCETANINKTVSAAVKQIDDIRYIQETKGLDKLPEGLKDMALTRLTYPEASLKELGSLLTPPVGKSGVNHRLRKLSEMAEELRAKQGGAL
ncbi:DNA-binding protein WhiA [bacterium]|uniref:DNA-binding protein WhiA n=1 Tax=Lachnospiraceae TaxID=186803 RepID=UPI002A2AF289|nr:DNA-binding protein WhiA [bacterium]MDY2886137.1 DNA-binding protein WhiA [Bariatricus sp.]MCI7148685.1 DNA-binding protein WhiA [bacterium]MDD6514121.1 DNA-binding protein WhiA [bacterium]MDD7142478.1 DNA-binding protein WhiA [bacterium]